MVDLFEEVESLSDLENFKARYQEEEGDPILTQSPPVDVVAFTEQRSCADIYRMYEKGQLDIHPDFQRGEVWTNRAQTLFVDSLLKQLPIPSMCICLDIHTQKRIVIDGLQRITSIVKFLNKNKDWKLALVDDVDKILSGQKVSELKENNAEAYEIIENVTIPITVIRCDYSKKEHKQYIFQIFYRLNSGGNKLYNQEIRNCIYNGSFNTLLKSLARSASWLEFLNTTVNKVDRSRSAHEERLLRFFAFYHNYQNYSGKLASFLNDYMEAHQNIDNDTEQQFTNLLEETLVIANKIQNRSASKNVIEAILVGVAKNKEYLKDIDNDVLNDKYNHLMSESEFSAEALKEGLGATDKLKGRILKAIQIFGND